MNYSLQGIPLIILMAFIRYFTESETGDEATCLLCTAEVWHLKEYLKNIFFYQKRQIGLIIFVEGWIKRGHNQWNVVAFKTISS